MHFLRGSGGISWPPCLAAGSSFPGFCRSIIKVTEKPLRFIPEEPSCNVRMLILKQSHLPACYDISTATELLLYRTVEAFLIDKNDI